MTVKELKEELNNFPDDCGVFIPNTEFYMILDVPPYIEATHVSRGLNELDNIIFLDNYEEDDEDD